MGLYDQFLQLNQQGLDTGNQIAMQRAQQPTMADVFMNRFRQGGQDLLAQQKQKMEEDYKNATVQNAAYGRQIGAVNAAAQNTSPDLVNTFNDLLTKQGLSPLPVGAKGVKIQGQEATAATKAADLAEKQRWHDMSDQQKSDKLQLLKDNAEHTNALIDWKVERGHTLLPEEIEYMRAGTALRNRMPVEAFTGAGGAKGAPPGYRWNGNNLEVVPGGPEDKRRTEGDINTDATTKAVVGQLDDLERQAQLVKQHPGLAGNFGLAGKIPNAPGTLSSDAAAQLDTLKSKLFRSTLDSLKEGSKAGNTGVGRVLASEIPMFINNIAPFEKPQSAEQVQQDIDRIVSWTQKTRQRILESAQNRGSENIRGSVGSVVPMPAPTGPAPRGGSRATVKVAQPTSYLNQRTSKPDGQYSIGGKTVTVENGVITKEE